MLENCGRYFKVSLMLYARYAHRYRQRHLYILCAHFVHLSVHLLEMLQYNREIVEALLNIEAIEPSCQKPRQTYGNTGNTNEFSFHMS